MKKTLIVIVLILAFLGSVSYVLLRMVNTGALQPIKVDVTQVDITVGKDSLGFVFHTNIDNPRNFIFHPTKLEYRAYMDTSEIAYGERNIISCDTCEGAVNDTFQLPLVLNLDKVKGKRANDETDSTDLLVKVDLYFDLFGMGLSKLPITINKRIPAPRPPQFELVSVDPEMIRIDTMVLSLQGMIINPNNFEVTLSMADLHVEFDDLFSGDITLTDTFQLKARDESVFTAQASVSDLQLVRDAFKVMFQIKSRPYSLKGTALMDLQDGSKPMRVNFYHTGNVKLKPWKQIFGRKKK